MVKRFSPADVKVASAPRKGEGRYRLEIGAYNPDSIPMGRLAEYMKSLAEMLGETTSVHFAGLETGSTVLVSRVEREAVPKVRQRVTTLRQGDGPADGLKAYKTINRLLREDNAVAALRERPKGATILRFPGREEVQEMLPAIRQHGTIDGMVVRIGGTDQTVHVTVESDSEQITGAFTTRPFAKELGHHLLRSFDSSVVADGDEAKMASGRW